MELVFYERQQGARLYNKYLTIQDDHHSWGMCTTSAELKIVMTTMVVVMSSLDPHMIR
jgi:hypothetical protein